MASCIPGITVRSTWGVSSAMEPIPVPDRLIRDEQGTASAADRAGLAVIPAHL